jgi:hypothetical protein
MMVKYCPRCGFQNPDDAMYCIRCGFPLTQPVNQPAAPNETLSGATGQWNVWIMSNPGSTWLFSNPSVSPSPSPNLGSNYAGWDGIGTGAF